MSLLAAIALALSIAFAGTAPAPEAPVQPAPVQQVQEHDPILEADAAATLDDHKVAKEFADKGTHFIASYVGTDDSSDSKFGEFTYESIDFPGKFHHYVYHALSFA